MLEQVRLIRSLGFDSVWAGEHHVTPEFHFFPQLPLLQRTTYLPADGAGVRARRKHGIPAHCTVPDGELSRLFFMGLEGLKIDPDAAPEVQFRRLSAIASWWAHRLRGRGIGHATCCGHHPCQHARELAGNGT
jgi:hypothetical protein